MTSEASDAAADAPFVESSVIHVNGQLDEGIQKKEEQETDTQIKDNELRSISQDPSDPEDSSSNAECSLARRTWTRRRLSKQKETVDEPDIHPETPVSEEESEDAAASTTTVSITRNDMEPNVSQQAVRSRQLVRGLALCGDDDTRLRPPPPPSLTRHSHSLSRDSSFTEYTDAKGIDLRTFVLQTLHKNLRDRTMILNLEKVLIDFVNDPSRQSYKFTAMSSYKRMIVHRVAVLFGLDHNVDNSGQCVVVNKTDRTALPEFDFSSLISTDIYMEPRRSVMRPVHSQDEIRDPSLMGGFYHSMSVEWASRRAQSFETNMMMYPQRTNQQWLHSPHAHSFDAPTATSPTPHQLNARNALLRKAGSFGGVPAYYRSGSGQHLCETPTDRPGNPVREPHYTSNGSVGHLSPLQPVMNDLNSSLGAMQVDVAMPPSAPSMGQQPLMYNRPSAHPEYVYGASYGSPQSQPLYVSQQVTSPRPMYSPNIQHVPCVYPVQFAHAPAPIHCNASMAPSSHYVYVDASGVEYSQEHSQQGHIANPAYMYRDTTRCKDLPTTAACVGIQMPIMYNVSPQLVNTTVYHPSPISTSQSLPNQIHFHQQQYLHMTTDNNQMRHHQSITQCPAPADPTIIHGVNLAISPIPPQSSMHGSVDRGYGSMTQDSLKESEYPPEHDQH